MSVTGSPTEAALSREILSRWSGFSFITSIATSARLCQALTSPAWIELLLNYITQHRVSLPRKIQALRLLRRALTSWDATHGSSKMDELVVRLLSMLGRCLLACDADPILAQQHDCNKTRRSSVPVSLSASYTSTLAEEMMALLRRLHSLDDWNALVNTHLLDRLRLASEMLIEKPATLTVFYTTSKHELQL